MTKIAAPNGPMAGGTAPAETDSRRQAQRWITVMDGQRLRWLRRQRCLSQEALAEQAGVSLTTVARLERQVRSPCRTWTLAMLAAALEEPFASLSSADFATEPGVPGG